MSINIKIPDKKIRNQPTRDIEEIMEKATKKEDQNVELMTDEEYIKEIAEDCGL